MNSVKTQTCRLHNQRKRIAHELYLSETIRGTMLKRYLECTRPRCRCHTSVGHRHGPYYFLAIRRKDKTKHVYVPKALVPQVKKWAAHYAKVRQGIEEITDINVKLIRLGST